MTLLRSAALSLIFAVAAVAVTPNTAEARGAPDGFTELAKRLSPSVVNISTAQTIEIDTSEAKPFEEGSPLERFNDFFGGRADRDGRVSKSLGSGFVIDDKGHIVTNNHVIEDADEITVVLNDRREFEAELVGTDPDTDIALLKIDTGDLKELKLAKSGNSRVGDYVIAVGNPFGLSSTVTSGIVSALGREQGGGNRYENYIQTDASINPGNSGGALVNSKGELIGINTAILTRSGGNNGIGFAVPVRTVKNVVEQLRENGEVRRGRIGVSIQDVTPELRASLGLSSLNGALIGQVVDGAPAEKAGLESGDVVVKFNGEDIIDSADLRNLVGLLQPGTRADITFLRDGSRRTTKITVAETPQEEELTERASIDDDEDLDVVEAFDGAEVSNIPKELDLIGGDEGVYVASIERGSLAWRSGLRRGDVIRQVGKNDISDLDDFEDAIRGDGPFALQVESRGQTRFLAVK